MTDRRVNKTGAEQRRLGTHAHIFIISSHLCLSLCLSLICHYKTPSLNKYFKKRKLKYRRVYNNTTTVWRCGEQ